MVLLLATAAPALPQAGWFWQNPKPQGSDLYSAALIDANTATVVGNFGTILRTTNGGTMWNEQSSGVVYALRGVSFTDANTGTAVGDLGTILRTTNGGATWVPQSSGAPFTFLNGVSFTDANTGTAVGSSGTILRTTDGGANWNPQTSGTTNALYGVWFSDVNNGAAVGDLGTVVRTTDGGTTWTKQVSRTSNRINSVHVINATIGTMVADAGGILHTTSGGAVAVEENPHAIPNEFVLGQNYPNPFNPTTVVRYQLPAASDVKLVVYDLLGRDVAVLVNEPKAPGSYEVRFDGRGLASGVYLYTLTAGGFLQTRKLLLLR
jgi:photosystem II stability/assembly factor-like uncharacterized protein